MKLPLKILAGAYIASKIVTTKILWDKTGGGMNALKGVDCLGADSVFISAKATGSIYNADPSTISKVQTALMALSPPGNQDPDIIALTTDFFNGKLKLGDFTTNTRKAVAAFNSKYGGDVNGGEAITDGTLNGLKIPLPIASKPGTTATSLPISLGPAPDAKTPSGGAQKSGSVTSYNLPPEEDGNFFTREIGGVPVYGWAGIGIVGLVGLGLIIRGSSKIILAKAS